MRYIAVYGILRSDLYGDAGEYAAHRRFMEPFADRVGPCKIPGVLYDAGLAALMPGDGEVVGELWEVRQPVNEAHLARLDGLEGAYDRRTVRLIEPDVDADAYFFNHLRGDDVLIPSGDWADARFALWTTKS